MKTPRSTNFVRAWSLLALIAAAEAQEPIAGWKGSVVEAAPGTWTATTNTPPSLLLTPADPSVQSTAALALPASAGAGTLQSVTLDLATIDPTGTLLAPGAELSFTARGPLAGLADEPLSTLRMRKMAGGRVEYAYGSGSTGAPTFTVELWNGGTLVNVSVGVTDPVLLPNCDAHPWCCWTAQVVWLGGQWHNAWTCVIPLDWQSQIYNVNRVVVIPENPVHAPTDVTSIEVSARGHSTLEFTDLTLTGFAATGTPYCTANPNSTGQVGTLMALGTNSILANDLELYAFDLPPFQFGLFVVSSAQAFVPNVGGSQGNLCIGANTGRFNAQLANSGPAGALRLDVDATAIPQPSSFVATLPGDTWNFQLWHRDFASTGPTSNFTEALSVTF